MVSLNIEVPELVLYDDGHFFGVCFFESFGDLYFGVVGEEGDVEVRVAGESVLGGD